MNLSGSSSKGMDSDEMSNWVVIFKMLRKPMTRGWRLERSVVVRAIITTWRVSQSVYARRDTRLSNHYHHHHLPALLINRWNTTCVLGKFECFVTKNEPSVTGWSLKSSSTTLNCVSMSAKWNSVDCWQRSNRALLLPLPVLYSRQPSTGRLVSSLTSTSTMAALRWLVYSLVAVSAR